MRMSRICNLQHRWPSGPGTGGSAGLAPSAPRPKARDRAAPGPILGRQQAAGPAAVRWRAETPGWRAARWRESGRARRPPPDATGRTRAHPAPGRACARAGGCAADPGRKDRGERLWRGQSGAPQRVGPRAPARGRGDPVGAGDGPVLPRLRARPGSGAAAAGRPTGTPPRHRNSRHRLPTTGGIGPRSRTASRTVAAAAVPARPV